MPGKALGDLKQMPIKEKKEEGRTSSVTLKLAIINSLVVLVLLAIVATFIMTRQNALVNYILGEYQGMVEESFNDQASQNSSDLSGRHNINTKISSGMAGFFVYNFDTDGLRNNLQNLMALPDIAAILIKDVSNKPFLALWKSEGSVESAAEVSGSVVLQPDKQFTEDMYYGEEKVGTVTLYYTDSLLLAQREKNHQKLTKKVSGLRSEINSKVRSATISQSSAFVFIIFALVMSIVLTLKILVINRLKNITSGLRDIAEGEGDLTKRLVDKTNDEIGELRKWFNVFVEKIHDIIADVSAGSKDLDNESERLNLLSTNMKDDAEQASVKAGNVANSSEEMSTNMSSVAAAMEEASTNINMVAAAAEEMNATINKISENTDHAMTIAVSAVDQTDSATRQVDELGSAAEGIGKVLETISEISEQVNLLALNATIEAARAGDAGKGFAVVANEIKGLAKQTAEATGEIKNRIEGIQNSTRGTVSHIEQIARVVNEVNEIVSTISLAITEQSTATEEIARNVAQASEGISEVNLNVAQSNSSVGAISEEIHEVTNAAEKITENSVVVSESAGKLSKLSSQLNTMVGRFKV